MHLEFLHMVRYNLDYIALFVLLLLFRSISPMSSIFTLLASTAFSFLYNPDIASNSSAPYSYAAAPLKYNTAYRVTAGRRF